MSFPFFTTIHKEAKKEAKNHIIHEVKEEAKIEINEEARHNENNPECYCKNCVGLRILMSYYY